MQIWYTQHTVSCSGCDDRYARCDNMNTVCVTVIPWYDIIKSGYDVINILGVKLYIEVWSVLNSCDSMHTEYDVTRIVCDIIQRVVVG